MPDPSINGFPAREGTILETILARDADLSVRYAATNHVVNIRKDGTLDFH